MGLGKQNRRSLRVPGGRSRALGHSWILYCVALLSFVFPPVLLSCLIFFPYPSVGFANWCFL